MTKGISRIDSTKAQGYLARYYPTGQSKQPISKFFSDSKYRGSNNALAAATEWLDDAESGNPKTKFVPPPRSNTQLLGVSETHHTSSGIVRRKLPCFQVSYVESGKRKTKRFYYKGLAEREIAKFEAELFAERVRG